MVTAIQLLTLALNTIRVVALFTGIYLLNECLLEIRAGRNLEGQVINLEAKVSSFEASLRTMGTIAQTNLCDAKDAWNDIRQLKRELKK